MKSKNYSEKILDVFKKKGFVFSEPDVLLDSNYIIQRSGENFKKVMLTFEDDSWKKYVFKARFNSCFLHKIFKRQF